MTELKFLHERNSLNSVKLDQFRRISTEVLKQSLAPGGRDCLKARPDGTVLDGHHRLAVLQERGEEINLLPRQIMEKES